MQPKVLSTSLLSYAEQDNNTYVSEPCRQSIKVGIAMLYKNTFDKLKVNNFLKIILNLNDISLQYSLKKV